MITTKKGMETAYTHTHICILYIVTDMWSIIGLKIRWIKSNKIIIVSFPGII